MDITLQMRSIELLIKFLKHDLQGVPSYGYALQKMPIPKAVSPKPLPRSTPEGMGVSSAAMERLFREIDARPSLAVHGAMVLRHGHVIAEGYWSPYRPALAHMLYSMSKSVTGTAVGIAVDEGLLSLDEQVGDIFKDIATPGQQKSMRGLTVRHLLTMSSGSRFNEVGSMLDGDWVRMFLESAPKFQPGTAFEYNSLNSYMLVAILRRKTGMSLVEYLKPRLFDPMHIEEYAWETCPQGMEKGGWGLSLRLEDCAKLGQLYLNKGVWEGKQLVSQDWVEQATRPQIATENGEMRHGYGFQIWMNGTDGYQFNGAFGQYVIVLPKQDVVVAVHSASPNLFAQTDLDELIRASLWIAEEEPLWESPQLHARMQARLAALTFTPVPLPEGWKQDPAACEELLSLLDGREYRLQSNTGGVLPQTLQAVHGNYTLGTDMLRFHRDGETLLVDFYEGCTCNTLRAGCAYTDGLVGCRGEMHQTAARFAWHIEADGDIRLRIVCCFLEAPNSRIFTFIFRQNEIRAIFDERPTVVESSRMLMRLVGYSETAFVKRMATGMKRLPGMNDETIAELMERFTQPVTEGGLIEHITPCLLETAEGRLEQAAPPPELEA